jgi:hypothetical protein
MGFARKSFQAPVISSSPVTQSSGLYYSLQSLELMLQFGAHFCSAPRVLVFLSRPREIDHDLWSGRIEKARELGIRPNRSLRNLEGRHDQTFSDSRGGGGFTSIFHRSLIR